MQSQNPNQATDNNTPTPPNGGKAAWLQDRLPGCFILLLGVLATFVGIVLPLKEMLNAQPYVWYSIEVVGAAILALVFGSVYAVFGRQEIDRLTLRPDKRGITVSGLIFIIVILGIMGLGLWGWDQVIAMLGYR